jgi:hypothetical protein
VSDTASTNGELALFRAVIVQALADATTYRVPHGPRAGSQASADPTHRERVERSRERIIDANRDHARAWLLGNSEDFREVCHMAGLDPDAVRVKAEEMAARNWPPTGITVH